MFYYFYFYICICCVLYDSTQGCEINLIDIETRLTQITTDLKTLRQDPNDFCIQALHEECETRILNQQIKEATINSFYQHIYYSIGESFSEISGANLEKSDSMSKVIVNVLIESLAKTNTWSHASHLIEKVYDVHHRAHEIEKIINQKQQEQQEHQEQQELLFITNLSFQEAKNKMKQHIMNSDTNINIKLFTILTGNRIPFLKGNIILQGQTDTEWLTTQEPQTLFKQLFKNEEEWIQYGKLISDIMISDLLREFLINNFFLNEEQVSDIFLVPDSALLLRINKTWMFVNDDILSRFSTDASRARTFHQNQDYLWHQENMIDAQSILSAKYV